jgi:GTPase
MTEEPEPDLEVWVERILRGDPQAVSRAITSVENRNGSARELLQKLFPHTGRSIMVGVTGPSGAGKSTLVASLTALLRKQGKTVGVLAVDPTSPMSGGAILGDRIRMQEHSGDPGTYIRSMATRGALGGLARATLDAALVLDAAGKDYILIETVGAGQDEVDVAKLADVTLVVLVPGLGDDIQVFKAGILEIADVFVINKSDLPGADRIEQEIESLLSLTPASEEAWRPPLVKTVATRGEGVAELLQAVSGCLEFTERLNQGNERRRRLWRDRLLEILRDRLLRDVMQQFEGNEAFDQVISSVADRAEDPYTAVDHILKQAGWHGTRHVSPGAAVLDHLGVAVESLAEAVKFYERTLGLKVAGYETIEQEKTNVALLPLGESRMELLEPTKPDSPIARFLSKRGPGLHHVCLRVPDLGETIAKLREAGVQLIDSEPQIGAGGHRYVFVHPRSAGGVLLELVEAAPEAKEL